MKLFNLKQKFLNYSVLDLMFIIIVSNILPVAMLGLLDISQTIYTILVALVYIIQSVLCLVYCYRQLSKITKTDYLILGVAIVNCMLSIGYSFYKLDYFNLKEVLFSISMIYNILIFILLVSKFSITKKDINQFLQRLVILGLFSVALNIILHFNDFSMIFVADNSYNLVFSSFFPNRNQFGIFMLIITISNTMLYKFNRENKYLVYGIIFIVNLFLSMSRTSMLGLFVFLVVFIFNEYIKGNKIKFYIDKKTVIILFFGIISLIILLLSTDFLSVINKMFIRTETIKSGSGRFDLWNDAFSIVMNNNLFVSVGRFTAINLNQLLFNSDLNQFHSIYIEKFVTHGLVGLIWLIVLLFMMLKSIIKLPDCLKSVLLASFISFLFISLFETTTRFSIGYADAMSTIFFFSFPLICSNCSDDYKGSVSRAEDKE